ncbi:uncharacterized protein LOC129906676 [Episyrphus balteatus]|uniref:uncharacterized protein LOC129906676 n=1 Tax=Episyrphus balteatus TaxID=286459 RepID=UPI0024851FD3|nr:uncharacterized protein LOC129906676 [Episyrphus balteatus]
MDKRKKRTSINQYLMYIELLEKDPIFRSGTTPRDAEPNCLNNKWKDLSARLNTCQNGPQLSPEEWKKRLNDWKNSTRCKYRRSISGEKDISMSPLEVKALSLFGKTPVLVRSSQTIEFKSEAKELYEAEKKHQAAAKSRVVNNQPENNTSLDEDLEGIFIDDEEYNEDESVEEVEIKERKVEATNGGIPKTKRRRTIETTVYEIKSFSPKNVLTSTPHTLAISSVESNCNMTPAATDQPPPAPSPPIQQSVEIHPSPVQPQINFDTSALEFQLKRIADIKAEKLKFEIAKYKFNNPGFDYPTDFL